MALERHPFGGVSPSSGRAQGPQALTGTSTRDPKPQRSGDSESPELGRGENHPRAADRKGAEPDTRRRDPSRLSRVASDTEPGGATFHAASLAKARTREGRANPGGTAIPPAEEYAPVVC